MNFLTFTLYKRFLPLSTSCQEINGIAIQITGDNYDDDNDDDDDEDDDDDDDGVDDDGDGGDNGDNDD